MPKDNLEDFLAEALGEEGPEWDDDLDLDTEAKDALYDADDTDLHDTKAEEDAK